jgi:hypothetical protein
VPVVQVQRHAGARRRRSLYLISTLLASLIAVQAHGESPSRHGSQGSGSEQLAVQVNDDRMTISVAKVPQVYLYGPIDAGAAQRVQAMIQSRRIPPNSDIYLNSPGGDVAAGMALGRLFRAGNMTTHLGSPRKTARQPIVPKSSQCVNACVYAYAGGLFRWAPTGSDRFGAQPLPSTFTPATDAAAYLKDMGVNPQVFGSTPGGEVTWLNADQMLANGLSNNGRLLPTAVNSPVSNVASISLTQMTREGEHRITLQCRPDGLTITAYYAIGADRARQMVARASRSYFEINDQPINSSDRVSASAVEQSVVVSQPLALAQLNQLLSAHLMAAWLADRGGAVRYGFWMSLDPVRNDLRTYGNNCEYLAKQAGAKKS